MSMKVDTSLQQKQRLTNLFFVYGSLKSNFYNNHILEDATYVGEAETLGQHRMIGLGGFPGVIWCGKRGGNFWEKGTAKIKGEVYKVDNEDTRARLDMLEGYPTFYDKQYVWTKYGTACMYVLSDEFLRGGGYENQPTIESGEWKQ